MASSDTGSFAAGSFADRVVFVAGGTAGIGRAAAIRFASLGASVFVVGRSAEKGAEVLASLSRGSPTQRHQFVRADLGLIRECDRVVAAFLGGFSATLDVLVLSQGVLVTRHLPTQEGLDGALVANYLSRFYLATRLAGALAASSLAPGGAAPGPRIVVVAASQNRPRGALTKLIIPKPILDLETWIAHGWSALSGMRLHGQSQFANDVFVTEYARRLSQSPTLSRVSVVCCGPGAVDTEIRRELPALVVKVGEWFFKNSTLTAEQGGDVVVTLATRGDVASGSLFNRTELLTDPYPETTDPHLGEALFDASERIIAQALALASPLKQVGDPGEVKP
jgi:NAD(P)-dependent dehydrogenase (short-subunit alcohol dehydrogenase family)